MKILIWWKWPCEDIYCEDLPDCIVEGTMGRSMGNAVHSPGVLYFWKVMSNKYMQHFGQVTCSKHFTYIYSFDLHNKSYEEAALIPFFFFYPSGNWSSESFSSLPKRAELAFEPRHSGFRIHVLPYCNVPLRALIMKSGPRVDCPSLFCLRPALLLSTCSFFTSSVSV